jgi:predicted transcriptional regulator
MRVTVRLSDDDCRRLDAAAARVGRTRSQAARNAIAAWADAAEGGDPAPEVADRAELLRLLTERARGGNVAAMGRLLNELRYDDPEADTGAGDALAELDAITDLSAVRHRRVRPREAPDAA